MSPRFLVTTGGLAVLLAAVSVSAQAPQFAAGKKALAAKVWTVPRTPDGHPDLQGVWTNVTITPLERPNTLAGKAVLSESEAAQLEEQAAETRVDRPPPPGDPGGYNQFWFDRGTKVVPTMRSSLILDPPDGRIPPLTPEAQKRQQDTQAYGRLHPADGPENRSLAERCILWATAGPPMMPGPYNSNYRIVQGPGYVAILVEMIHDARVIPTDGHPHLPDNIRQWMGDSRGHWEGDTLVVETTNFTNRTHYRGADEKLRLVERFRLTDANTIDYQFTVDDPTAFTRPWTASIPMTRSQGSLFEYACSEGNYALTDILAGARADEKRKQ